MPSPRSSASCCGRWRSLRTIAIRPPTRCADAVAGVPVEPRVSAITAEASACSPAKIPSSIASRRPRSRHPSWPRHRRRSRRTRLIGSAVAVAAVAVVAVGASIMRSGERPAQPSPEPPPATASTPAAEPAPIPPAASRRQLRPNRRLRNPSALRRANRRQVQRSTGRRQPCRRQQRAATETQPPAVCARRRRWPRDRTPPASCSSRSTRVDSPGLRFRHDCRLERTTAKMDVDPSARTFKTGDRSPVRVRIEHRRLSVCRAAGIERQLDGAVSAPGDQRRPQQRCNASRSNEVPSRADGWFRFDGPPGTEHVFVFLSREPVDQLPGFERVLQAVTVTGRSRRRSAGASIQSRDLDLPEGHGADGPRHVDREGHLRRESTPRSARPSRRASSLIHGQ